MRAPILAQHDLIAERATLLCGHHLEGRRNSEIGEYAISRVVFSQLTVQSEYAYSYHQQVSIQSTNMLAANDCTRGLVALTLSSLASARNPTWNDRYDPKIRNSSTFVNSTYEEVAVSGESSRCPSYQPLKLYDGLQYEN